MQGLSPKQAQTKIETQKQVKLVDKFLQTMKDQDKLLPSNYSKILPTKHEDDIISGNYEMKNLIPSNIDLGETKDKMIISGKMTTA